METDVRDVPYDFEGQELVLALVGGEPPLVLGSAVLIAPGVALTASHVIEEYWNQTGEKDGWRTEDAATFALQAVQFVPHLDRFVMWHVFLVTHRDTLDIALLQLTPEPSQYPDAYVWPYATLDFRPIVKGARVEAFGFPKADVLYDEQIKGWSLKHAAAGSMGVVTDVFEAGKDRAKKPFPCFEMDIEIRGGMSGGPVVNADGHMCGIVTTGWTFAEPGPHLSAGSLLQPALDFPVMGTGNLGAPGQHLVLSDLVGLGHLMTVGL
jgi:S1-C subfamily serine protease